MIRAFVDRGMRVVVETTLDGYPPYDPEAIEAALTRNRAAAQDGDVEREVDRHPDRRLVAGDRGRQRLEDAPPGSPIGGGAHDFWGDCNG